MVASASTDLPFWLDAQLGQFECPPALGLVVLIGKDQGQLVACPRVGRRVVGECLKDLFGLGEVLALHGPRGRAVRLTSIDLGSSLAATSRWVWASSPRPCSRSHAATPSWTGNESGVFLAA